MDFLDYEIHDENINDPNSTNIQIIWEEIGKVVPKIVQTVTEMFRKYIGSGRIINMDSLYSSPGVVLLWRKRDFMHMEMLGWLKDTFQKFIKFLKKNMKYYPRGSYKFTSNIEHNISMHCWHYKNPAHVLSTCDSTGIDIVKR